MDIKVKTVFQSKSTLKHGRPGATLEDNKM